MPSARTDQSVKMVTQVQVLPHVIVLMVLLIKASPWKTIYVEEKWYDMFTIFLQQILNDKLLLVVIVVVGAKK